MSSAVPLFTGEVTQEQADQVLLLIENLINNAKWKSEGLVQGIEMVSAPYPQSPLKMYRAICVVPNTNSKNLANEIWMMNTPKKINMYDKSVSKFKTVETINENIRVDFVEAAMPWPVWNRDLVYAIARKNSADVIYMWAYSIIRPNVPSAEKTVRMKVISISFFCIIKIRTKTKFSII